MKVLYGVKDPWYLYDIRTEQTFWDSITYKVKWKRFMKKLRQVHKDILHNKKHGYSSKNLILKEAILAQKLAKLKQMSYMNGTNSQEMKNVIKISEQVEIQNLLHRCIKNTVEK